MPEAEQEAVPAADPVSAASADESMEELTKLKGPLKAACSHRTSSTLRNRRSSRTSNPEV
jgi:hypothetical protein